MTKPSPSHQYDDRTFTENKQFERCLALGYLGIEDESTRWREISLQLGGKRTPEEVEIHYKKLIFDIELIESGRVSLPSYKDDANESDDESECVQRDSVSPVDSCSTHPTTRPIRKGAQWTEEEHRLFLIGLARYTKGDWRSISRNLVITRSPTQVASHAQKYFNRGSRNKHRKRSSIHDITHFDDDSVLNLSQQGLISRAMLLDLRQNGVVSTDVVKALQPYFDAQQLESSPIPNQLEPAMSQLQVQTNEQVGYVSCNLIPNQLQTHEQLSYMSNNLILDQYEQAMNHNIIWENQLQTNEQHEQVSYICNNLIPDQYEEAMNHNNICENQLQTHEQVSYMSQS